MSEMENTGIARRSFLKGALTVGAVGAVSAITGCSSGASGSTESPSSGTSAPQTEQPSQAQNAWEVKPEPITDTVDTKTADIVVVGAGVAGLVAAAKAAELGSVIIVEKGSTVATVRECEWAFNAKVQNDAGIFFTEEDRLKAIGDFMELSRYTMVDQEVITSFVDHSGELVDWIAPILAQGDNGVTVKYEPAYGKFGVSYGTLGFPVQDWFIPLKEFIESQGAEFRFNEPAVQLVQDSDGSVTGVITKNEMDEYIQYNAGKGVILCAGGFGLNPEMMAEFFPRSELFSREIFFPTHTGDGLIMGMQAGAEMDRVCWSDLFLGADTQLTNPNEIKITAIYSPSVGTLPMLYVNVAGHRSLNEKGRMYNDAVKTGTQADIDIACGVLWQPEGRMWSIWDSAWEEKLSNVVDMSTTTSMYPNPMVNNQANLARDVENGVTLRADSIDELANLIGVEPETLQSTINRYNELCAKGVDDDFFKESQWMTSIDTPPYYAVKILGIPCCTRGGLRIDKYGNVLDKTGKAIKGLYASGLNAGGAYGFNAMLGSVSITQMFGYLGVQAAHGAL
jgi:fumarate reductase flavoprotein subunit